MVVIKTACLIDDDLIYRYALEELFLHYKFCKELLLYSDGKEAIDKLTERQKAGLPFPEIIFLDINMPQMDGWQFLDEFKKQQFNADPTIYVISTSSFDEDRQKAREYNEVDRYMIKPVSLEQIKDVVEEYIEAFQSKKS